MLTWCRQKKQTSVDDDDVQFLKEEEVPTLIISSLKRA
jgi:hypothetical protein